MAGGKRVSTFTSIWRREKSGGWELIFGRGCVACAACEEKDQSAAQ